jgi:ABC-type iron transport system FetAB ATPase subunit
MTGQILGGSPVTEAAHYQILIIYLISTCTFLTIFMNIYAMYRVAFDTGTHIFRVDRFVKVEKQKLLSLSQRFKLALISAKIFAKKVMGLSLGAVFSKVILCLKVSLCCFKVWKRHQHSDEELSDLERQPLSDDLGIASPKYDSSSENKVQILSNKDTKASESSDVFRISNLQFSVPESVGKKKETNSEQSSSDHPSGDGDQSTAPISNAHEDNRRILCTNLCASFTKGEIGIVRGPSGSGKSTLMRVLSGLTEADSGDVFVSDLTCNLLLSDCKNGSSREDMVRWRSEVRYVTQYKVDVPGTPRDFIDRIKRFRSYSTHTSEDLLTPSIVSSTIAYLKDWGMGETSTSDPTSFDSENEHDPFLDKEWKSLSGGESQRMLLAIALSTRPRILLLDESTSGLDAKTEQRVEKSLIEYVNESGAAILWVTHSEDIATRLLNN